MEENADACDVLTAVQAQISSYKNSCVSAFVRVGNRVKYISNGMVQASWKVRTPRKLKKKLHKLRATGHYI